MVFGNWLNLRKQHGWTLISIALIVAIALLSMRTFAAIHTPTFNSDNAIHVLMAYHLKLPDDLYYWGQDRLGSLLPVLSHWLLKILPLPVATAVSIVQYALLVFGFVCFASLLRHAVSRVVLALVWFLPLRPFTELVSIGQPYAAQLALIGAACVAIDRRSQSTQLAAKRGWLGIATACLFLSLWMSDFTIVVILLLGLWGLWQMLSAWRSNQPVPVWDLLLVLLVSGAGMAFIRFAKAHADSWRSYSSFATPAQTIEMVQRLLTSIGNTLTFQANNLFLTLHGLLAVALLVYLGWTIATRRQILRSVSHWFYLFLGTVLVGSSLLLISAWVYRNEVNLRYFIVSYLAIWLAVLFWLEALPSGVAKRASILVLLVAIASSLSLPKYVYAIERPPSKITSLQEFKTLGNAGLIGNYWNSYLLCAVDPANLNCSRFDRLGKSPCPPASNPQQDVGRVRCRRCVPEVFASDTIYLVKEKWFDTAPYRDYPNEIQQFGKCLVKAGEPRQVSGYTIAPYRIKPSVNPSIQ